MLLESPANDVEGEADGGGDQGSFMVEQVPLKLHFVNGMGYSRHNENRPIFRHSVINCSLVKPGLAC